MSSELIIRGYTEYLIDNELSAENLAKKHKFFESLKPVVENRRDAIFGYILGKVMTKILDLFDLLKQEPTQEELIQVATATRKRYLEIKSRINETFT